MTIAKLQFQISTNTNHHLLRNTNPKRLLKLTTRRNKRQREKLDESLRGRGKRSKDVKRNKPIIITHIVRSVLEARVQKYDTLERALTGQISTVDLGLVRLLIRFEKVMNQMGMVLRQLERLILGIMFILDKCPQKRSL